MIPENERERLQAVRRYEVLDTPPDGAFDRITALAARHFRVPISIVSVVDADRIWFKSHHGLEAEEVDRDPGLCASAVLQDLPWVVEDAPRDPRTLANPLVAGELGLRFYAGAPLTTRDGFNLGTLCVIDKAPRRLTDDQTATLCDMAGVVMDQLELRLAARRLEAQQREKERRIAEEHVRAVKRTGVQALLSAIEARDSYTAAHSGNVVELAQAVAGELNLPDAERAEVEQVALLHDLGKIGVPDHILQHPGRLDEEARERMQAHPGIGEKIVASLDGLAHLAPAVRAEHERWDGHGYPDGLKGEEIPLASRIVLACDAYDAMTTDRPYRGAMDPRDAREELRANAGAQFDPAVAQALLEVLDRADDVSARGPRARRPPEVAVPASAADGR
ncbi:MAG: HD domain-containing protein [Actinomycetota bacterium]|nr:HD domain-containing protein [Actinomycetota bacterium]